ncbi:hypothetical protein [Leisingera sp. ANG-M7]|uniref:hypothetical protein n=1 Tax=Leisingera sp. ANG-M7 TaxID=1577902 RepID=UPI00057E1435|nr:hypothetical protein [Leisingera sp. ANG-M7]KIC36828.1 hypothetical protein RA26_10925 [Leisingera sp. ANG-M7]
MKLLKTTLCIATLLAPASLHATPAAALAPAFGPDVVMHGGGCRKSSPPGQCCHMKKATGEVHCH